jgi:hypothetical protein
MDKYRLWICENSTIIYSDLKESGAEVLEGRAKSVSAKHYLLHEIDKMVEQYHNGWISLHSVIL